jgi:hypothetical protein
VGLGKRAGIVKRAGLWLLLAPEEEGGATQQPLVDVAATRHLQVGHDAFTRDVKVDGQGDGLLASVRVRRVLQATKISNN